jgi:hypothetical protein
MKAKEMNQMSVMVSVKQHYQLEIHMKDIIKMVKEMVKAHISK